VTEEDRALWDARHSAGAAAGDLEAPAIPAVFAAYEDRFPTSGFALDLACGSGGASVWLAARGLEVCGVDVSPVGLERARRRAAAHRVAGRCRFQVADLDLGLPPGPPADVVVCHLFRNPRLYRPIVERLKPGGLLAIAVLSEVGGVRGPFRAPAGELNEAFGALSAMGGGEDDGRAWLLARKRSGRPAAGATLG
jgi:SAM-dependent methyltransferase